MLKRPITYTDFDGNKVTEVFYFHISKVELIEKEVDGLKESIERIVAAEDKKALIKEFKKIILDSYGQKSDDGKRFIKTDELRDNFAQTGAFESLFMELATNDTSAADFITGILPKDLAGELAGTTDQDKPKLLNPVPKPPMPPATA